MYNRYMLEDFHHIKEPVHRNLLVSDKSLLDHLEARLERVKVVQSVVIYEL